MHCPDCGALMNHHADKLLTKSDVPEGEVVLLIYCCPRCGKVEAVPEVSGSYSV
jgi:ribosomal protein S27AE